MVVRNFEVVSYNETFSISDFLDEDIKRDSRIYYIYDNNYYLDNQFSLNPLEQRYLLRAKSRDDTFYSHYAILLNRSNIFSMSWDIQYPIYQLVSENDTSNSSNVKFEDVINKGSKLQSPDELNSEITKIKGEINSENLTEEEVVRLRTLKLDEEGLNQFQEVFVNDDPVRDWGEMKRWLDENYPETEL
jgi:hypothetical protein